MAVGPVSVAMIQSLDWEPPYAAGTPLKRQKTKKKKEFHTIGVLRVLSGRFYMSPKSFHGVCNIKTMFMEATDKGQTSKIYKQFI